MANASSGGYLVAMENNTNVPRPSSIQTASAIFVIAMTAWRIAVVFIRLEDDPHTFPSAITSTVILLVLIGAQYCGMFRYWIKGVIIVKAMLTLGVVVASIVLFAYVAATMLPTIPFVLIKVAVDLALIILTSIALRANWLWHATLQKAKAEGNLPSQQKSFSLMELMGATLLVASMIAPASYRAATNQSLYARDVSPADAPFAAPATAEGLAFLRERHGAIRAQWYQDRSDFDAWLEERRQSAEVENFTLRDVQDPQDVRRPSEPRFSNSFYNLLEITEGNEVVWDSGNRHVRIIWPIPPVDYPEDLPIQAYYHETSRD